MSRRPPYPFGYKPNRWIPKHGRLCCRSWKRWCRPAAQNRFIPKDLLYGEVEERGIGVMVVIHRHWCPGLASYKVVPAPRWAVEFSGQNWMWRLPQSVRTLEEAERSVTEAMLCLGYVGEPAVGGWIAMPQEAPAAAAPVGAEDDLPARR